MSQTPPAMEAMYAAARQLIEATRAAYPKASEATIKICCEAAIEIELEEMFKEPTP